MAPIPHMFPSNYVHDVLHNAIHAITHNHLRDGVCLMNNHSQVQNSTKYSNIQTPLPGSLKADGTYILIFSPNQFIILILDWMENSVKVPFSFISMTSLKMKIDFPLFVE